MPSSEFRVLIIGAGTGGLCLAHGLRRAGIPVAVRERDSSATGGLLGYRVGIDADGSRALRDCLPAELFDLFVATCARTPTYVNMFTERLAELLSLEIPTPANPAEDPVVSEKSVSRMVLRQVLLSGLESVVGFGATFSHYRQRRDGRITAVFEDGSEETADVLVGADGTGSRVRAQYLPQARMADSGLIAVTGRLPLTERTERLLGDRMIRGVNMVFAPKGYSLILHAVRFPWNGGAPELGDGAEGRRLLAATVPGGTLEDYVMFGFNAARRRLPADVMRLRGTELLDVVRQRVGRWHPSVRELVDTADPEQSFPLNIRTSVPLPAWPSSPVTLLGDAIHTMTPGRGVGANTALRDAQLLCRNLVAARDQRTSVVAAIADYERQMIDYGFTAVAESRKQFSADDPLHRPVIGRVALWGMRAALRRVNRDPAAKRRMAEAQLRFRGADRAAKVTPS